ncbi:MAG: polysaccharide biosynthesis/export family protein [Planctomycetota bacterium]
MRHFAWLILIALSVCACGCHRLTVNAMRPTEIPLDAVPESRSTLVPIDHRLLGADIPPEHTVAAGDVLGVYIETVLDTEGQLPNVDYPSFRTKNAPVEPFVGLPVKVEAEGTINLPFIDPIYVNGFSIPQVRLAIKEAYVRSKKLVKGRENIMVSLITPRSFRINVVRQDTRYNQPGLQQPNQFEVSQRWSGTTVYLEPKEASVLTALLTTGGLPGIDAMNEIWVMKGVANSDLTREIVPMISKLEGPSPIMIPKGDTKLIRIPLTQQIGADLPFGPEDVRLGDGDVVFLPRREGDLFFTGGLLPAGRFPLPRDRDVDVLEAIAMCTGNTYGPVGGQNSGILKGGIGAIIPPTDLFIIRRVHKNKQIKIRVNLNRCFDDPNERIHISKGDMLVLKYRPIELAGNLALNLFNLNFTVSKVLGNTSGTTVVQ